VAVNDWQVALFTLSQNDACTEIVECGARNRCVRLILLILDNLTNVLVRDSDKRDYAPMVVLDYKGVRRYPSAFWMIE
jgi:hypothetical protein